MSESQYTGLYDFVKYPGNSRPVQDIRLNSNRGVTYYGSSTAKTPDSTSALQLGTTEYCGGKNELYYNSPLYKLYKKAKSAYDSAREKVSLKKNHLDSLQPTDACYSVANTEYKNEKEATDYDKK